MTFEIYSTSGETTNYMNTLVHSGYVVRGNIYEVFVEIESLERLYKLTEFLGHKIVILSRITDKSNPLIEIYDEARE